MWHSEMNSGLALDESGFILAPLITMLVEIQFAMAHFPHLE